jgi:hypothetical protein
MSKDIPMGGIPMMRGLKLLLRHIETPGMVKSV